MSDILGQSQYYGYFEPARTIQIPGAPHDHEVRVWLPPSYHLTDKLYPTLWITDNFLEIAWSALTCSAWGVAPELILVSVGSPRDEINNADFVNRRSWDFYPDEKWFIPGMLALLGSPQTGGADSFRDYLIDVLRPELAGQYRMDPADHGLFGHSGGCIFTSYCLFSRPDGFTKFMASSGIGLDYQGLAAANLADRDDLAVRAYFACGGEEGDVIAQNLKNMLEVLQKRNFPSLETSFSQHPGMDHFTEIPVMMMEGTRWLWREGLIHREWMAGFRAAFSALGS